MNQGSHNSKDSTGNNMKDDTKMSDQSGMQNGNK